MAFFYKNILVRFFTCFYGFLYFWTAKMDLATNLWYCYFLYVCIVMIKINLSLFTHKKKLQLKIGFAYNYEVKEYVKKFPLVRWSATYRTFYLPFSKENTNNLYLYLKKNNYKVDYTNVLKTLEKQKKLAPLQDKFAPYIKAFKLWLLQKRYSDNTVRTYISMIDLFFRFYPEKNVSTIKKIDIENFNTHYILKHKYSFTFQNQLINAVKLFYSYTHNEDLDLNDLDRPQKVKRLPEVLSIDEVKSILFSIKNTKHKTLLSLLYSCGLRIGEALNIKVSSIDLSRKLLHIKSGKGRKDRYLPISPIMIGLLEKYIQQYKPKLYLFEGQSSPKYSAVSARQVLKRVLKNTQIQKHVTLHTLRHSYATHLLENGTDLRFIQELLGHSSPKTTMIYTHVSTTSLEKIKNPFDDFDI